MNDQADDDDQERSLSGAPIWRHEPRKSDWTLPEKSGVNLEEIEAHLEKYVGKVDMVFHEILSDLVHLDVMHLKVAGDGGYNLLVTSGMSDLPMTVPEGLEEFRRAELMIALPADWPLTQEAFADEANYWPVRWLKQLGRLPHEYQTWLGWGHTVPNGDPAEPIADTNFTGVVLLPPFWLPAEFFQLKTAGGETISFYAMTPLYQEEMDLKLRDGLDELVERFEQREIDSVVDVRRPNVAFDF
jgi:hypothetical protein